MNYVILIGGCAFSTRAYLLFAYELHYFDRLCGGYGKNSPQIMPTFYPAQYTQAGLGSCLPVRSRIVG